MHASLDISALNDSERKRGKYLLQRSHLHVYKSVLSEQLMAIFFLRNGEGHDYVLAVEGSVYSNDCVYVTRMCILYTRNPLVTMPIDKVKWITADNCGKPKWHSFTPSLSWKGEKGLDIVLQNVQKKNYWTKIADLGIPHPLVPVIASTCYGKYTGWPHKTEQSIF